MSIEQLVPREREAHERARAFRAAIEAKAVPDTGIMSLAAHRRIEAEKRYEEMDRRRWAILDRQEREIRSITHGAWPSLSRIRRLQMCVAKFYETPLDKLLSQLRCEPLVMHRQIGIYFAREELKLSYPAIGSKFGGRNHTTAIHAHRKIGARRLVDGDFSDELDLLAQLIRAELADTAIPAERALLRQEAAE